MQKIHHMPSIAIYAITSELHDADAVHSATIEFLNSLGFDYDLRGDDFSDYGSHALHLIFIRTGGTEGQFKKILPLLQRQSGQPVYLLTSGKSNSLAASMEILSYLYQHHISGEIIHGSAAYISQRVSMLEKAESAKRKWSRCRLGVVGKPSDWLISSGTDYDVVKQRTGISLVDIPMDELLALYEQTPVRDDVQKTGIGPVDLALAGAYRIYDALRAVVKKYELSGFTIRCFDLLSAVHNTGCLALAKLNAEGIVAGCEGDIPAMLTMAIAQSALSCSGFQANPAFVDVDAGEILFAHCTIPFDMVERFEYDTHFESGIGVGIRGFAPCGPVTVFKVSGDLTRHFIAEGELLACESSPGLCRTQMRIRLNDKEAASYFLRHPIGNHHIVVQGHHRALFKQLLM